MKVPFLFLLACIQVSIASAQSKTCTQGCDETRVLLFDFDVKANTASANPELYKRLFYVAPQLRNALTSRSSCLELLDGNEVKRPEDVYQGGNTVPNINVQGPEAYYFGEYLLTGTVTGEGTVFLVTANIETSVSRKKIKTVQATLNFNEGDTYISAAQKLEAAFGPLEVLIKNYETKERETNTMVAFGKTNAQGKDIPELLKVKPKKTKLQMGEETEVEITLKDCDGTPLSGRTVSFTGEMYNGFWRKGTYGGTVTPSKVVTDAEGKAKVKFKAGKEYAFAAIVAHYCFEQPCGRKDVITGSAAIDMQLKPYRVIAMYTQTLSSKINSVNTTSEYTEKRQGNSHYQVEYLTEFYYAPRVPQDGLQVNSLDDSTVAKIYVVQEKATSSDFASLYYQKKYKSGDQLSEHTLLNTKGVLSPENKPAVAADTSGMHMFSFALELLKTGVLNGKELEPGIYPAAQVAAYEGDGHSIYTSAKFVKDNTQYKVAPGFLYTNITNKNDHGTSTNVSESFMVRIFVEK